MRLWAFLKRGHFLEEHLVLWFEKKHCWRDRKLSSKPHEFKIAVKRGDSWSGNNVSGISSRHPSIVHWYILALIRGVLRLLFMTEIRTVLLLSGREWTVAQSSKNWGRDRQTESTQACSYQLVTWIQLGISGAHCWSLRLWLSQTRAARGLSTVSAFKIDSGTVERFGRDNNATWRPQWLAVTEMATLKLTQLQVHCVAPTVWLWWHLRWPFNSEMSLSVKVLPCRRPISWPCSKAGYMVRGSHDSAVHRASERNLEDERVTQPSETCVHACMNIKGLGDRQSQRHGDRRRLWGANFFIDVVLPPLDLW